MMEAGFFALLVSAAEMCGEVVLLHAAGERKKTVFSCWPSRAAEDCCCAGGGGR